LREPSALCYKRRMRDLREWISEKMRRRPRRGPNDSESTGKSGQELPSNQPAPLRPTYPEAAPARAAEPEPVRAERAVEPAAATVPPAEHSAPTEPAEPKMVMETQPESLGTPPAELTATKSPKGYVVLAIGLPGSGKTTWYKRRGVTPLSSDLLRTLLFDDITEQRYQGLVFSTLRSLLRARLIAKMPWNYVDATNLSPHERRQWIKMVLRRAIGRMHGTQLEARSPGDRRGDAEDGRTPEAAHLQGRLREDHRGARQGPARCSRRAGNCRRRPGDCRINSQFATG
jgi:hypothetical protein